MKVTGSHELYQQFKFLKYSIPKDLRNAYWEYINNSLISVDTASFNCIKQFKKFWSYIKSLKKSSTDIPLLKTKIGTVTDNLDKAESLNTQFQSVFTNKDFTVFPEKGPSPHPSVHLTCETQLLSLFHELVSNNDHMH